MQFEQLAAAVLALFPPLDETEQRVSLALYRLLAEGRPVSPAGVAQAARVAPSEIEHMLARWPALYRDREGRVIGYAGLTIAETKHRMRIDGEQLYTWCAWDALFLPPLLGVSAQVDSTCGGSGESVALTVHPDRVEAADSPPLVSLVAPDPGAAQADIVRHFCCHVQFFATAGAAEKWKSGHPGTRVATLEQAWQLGQRRNALRYPARQA